MSRFLALAAAAFLAHQRSGGIARAQSCNTSDTTEEACADTCTGLPGACRCDGNYGRCACRHEGSALSRDGDCVALQDATGAEACSAGQLAARALLVLGTRPSPELDQGHLESGHPSGALIAILWRSTAAAMQLEPDSIRVLNPRLIPVSLEQVPGQTQNPSILLADVAFEFCATGADVLPEGARFEHRLAVAAQNFFAFSIATIRVLELEPTTSVTPSDRSDGPDDAEEGPVARGSDEEGSQGEAEELREGIFLWTGTAILVILVLLGLSTVKLIRARRARRAKRDQDVTAVVESGFTPAFPADVHGMSPTQQAAGNFALVSYPFDASAEADAAVAAAAGVDPSECLLVFVGDAVQIIAQGEAWLYCQKCERDGTWTSGFLPAAHTTQHPTTMSGSAEMLPAPVPQL